MAFASRCVRPGDTQTIKVRLEDAGQVAYHAQYSDGKNAFEPGYYGGNEGGPTDESGAYEDTWQIAPTAPPGPVDVLVVGITDTERGNTNAQFQLADVAGRCS